MRPGFNIGRSSWKQTGELKKNGLRRGKVDAPKSPRSRNRQGRSRGEKTKRKKPKVVRWDENSQVGNAIIDRPSQYAIHRLKNFEYIPLWYFCREGCRDATEDASATGSEALGLTKTVNGLAFLPAAAGRPSKRALQDHELTWSQFDLAYTSFITHIQTYKWPEHYVDALINFFGNLVTHPLRREDQGHKVLLLYASQVRREWHDCLDRDQAFNVGVINEKLLDNIMRQVHNSTQSSIKRQASFFLARFLLNTKVLLSHHYLWSFIATTLPPLPLLPCYHRYHRFHATTATMLPPLPCCRCSHATTF